MEECLFMKRRTRMNKIGNRAFAVLLIACMILAGLGIYLKQYYEEGESWAKYFSMQNSGTTGEILDRNGVILAKFDSSESVFSDDELTRKACYHVIGDYWGRTPTGALSVYRDGMSQYSVFTGTTHGHDTYLNLTLDSRLNCKAYEELGEDRDGAIMIMNYRTGEILCMVSGPSTDPNDGNAELRDGTFINKCLSASFVPGSSFKIVTTAAAIENLPDYRNLSFFCDNEYEIAGVPIGCTGPHYTQNFEQALNNSCNIAFAQISVMLGQDTIAEYADKYGFLSSHELDGIPSAVGSFPLEFVGDPETAWAGIGQSTDLVCPYTMLRYVSAIANDGVLVEPHIISGRPTEESQLISSSTAGELSLLMHSNFINHYDPENNFPGLDLSAKTGTAELGDDTTNAWFVGFLNDDAHPYAFVFLVERGGGGLTVAGALANQVLQYAVSLSGSSSVQTGSEVNTQ